jgi:hypothetical protein
MTGTIDEALTTPGPLVAAWECWTARPTRTLVLYSVRSTPKLLARIEVSEAESYAKSTELARRGVRVGAYAPLSDRFWCVDREGFALWSMTRLELEGKGGELFFADGRRVRGAEVRAVTPFVENDMLHRGVRLELVDGSSVVIADEEDSAPLADPTYNRDNLAIDAAWTEYLGAALAKWLGKEHVDEGREDRPRSATPRAARYDVATAIGEQRGVPVRAEIATLLETYFVGPIGDDAIDKLHAEVARILTDPALRGGVVRSYAPNNGGLGFGCAWREELAFRRTTPRSIDLAAFIAWSHKGFPPARPYCPDVFVGRWLQRDETAPAPMLWTLGADGAFSAAGTAFDGRKRWCFHRQSEDANDGSIWLDDRHSGTHKRLLVLHVTATELALQPTSGPALRLERSTSL